MHVCSKQCPLMKLWSWGTEDERVQHFAEMMLSGNGGSSCRALGPEEGRRTAFISRHLRIQQLHQIHLSFSDGRVGFAARNNRFYHFSYWRALVSHHNTMTGAHQLTASGLSATRGVRAAVSQGQMLPPIPPSMKSSPRCVVLGTHHPRSSQLHCELFYWENGLKRKAAVTEFGKGIFSPNQLERERVAGEGRERKKRGALEPLNYP